MGTNALPNTYKSCTGILGLNTFYRGFTLSDSVLALRQALEPYAGDENSALIDSYPHANEILKYAQEAFLRVETAFQERKLGVWQALADERA